MFILDAAGKKVELIDAKPRWSARAGIIREGAVLPDVSTSIVDGDAEHRAFRAFFEIDRGTRAARTGSAKLAKAAKPAQKGPPPTVVREAETGLVRTFHREIVVRFAPKVSASRKKRILAKWDLAVRRVNTYIPDQIVAYDAKKTRDGDQLVNIANDCARMEEVRFATPNFVSEYRRQAIPTIPTGQWHLHNKGTVAGQLAGEDVDARDAWNITRGKSSIVVAVLDDGVDIDHPTLKSRIWKNPNRRWVEEYWTRPAPLRANSRSSVTA